MAKNKAGKDEDDLLITRRELYDLLQLIMERMQDPYSHDHSSRVVSGAIESGMWASELFDNLKKDSYQ